MPKISIVEYLNWVDFLVLVLGARILYISSKRGIFQEFFKVSGVYASLLLGIHFSYLWGRFLSQRTPLPPESAASVALCVIVVAVLFVFRLIRQGFSLIFKIETLSLVNKLGGFLLGAMRIILVGCLINISFTLSSIDYLRSMSSDSYLYPYAVKISRANYNLFCSLLNKFVPQIESNPKIKDL